MSGDAFALGDRVALHELRISPRPSETLPADHHAAHLRLRLEVAGQAEPSAELGLFAEHGGGVEAHQVAAVEIPVVVALPFEAVLVPLRVTVVHHQIQLEVAVRPVLRDALPRVRGAPHRGDALAGLDAVADLQAGPDGAEMRVERIDFQPLDRVPEH